MSSRKQTYDEILASLKTVEKSSNDGWVELEFSTRIEGHIARNTLNNKGRTESTRIQTSLSYPTKKSKTILKIRRIYKNEQ